MYYQITLSLYFIFLTVAFITSLTSYSKLNKVNYLKYFPPFLFITLCVEIAAIIIGYKYGDNQFMYNFFTIIAYLFYFFVLYQGINNKYAKKLILATMVAFPAFAFYMIFYKYGMYEFNTYTFGVGALLLVLYCIFYFRFQFFETPIHEDIKRDPLVFICLGLTVFHTITFTYFCGIHIFKDFSPSFVQNMSLVCMIANYVLYSFFTVAFLVNHKYSKINPPKFTQIP